MDELGIKQEFIGDEMLCWTCLSVGRRLVSLEKYIDIFKQLIPEFNAKTATSSIQLAICWECRALLQKIAQFQRNVREANHLLHTGQNYLCSTLSTLTTIVINDTHPDVIYVNETNIQTDVSTNNKAESSDGFEHIHNDCDDHETDQEDHENTELIKNDAILSKSDSDVKRKNNKWAKKRALQNKKPKFRIVKCDKAFRLVHMSSVELANLMEQAREIGTYKSMRYWCDSCIVGFNKEIQISKHNIKYHRQDLPYVCDVCNTSFQYKRHLSAHIEKHYRKYVCALCNYSCQDNIQINRHLRGHKKVFECLKCGLKFGRRREFFKHYKEWHEKFICDYCGINFKMRYCIKDHIRKQHSPFICKPCDKRFARYNGLWLHNKTRHTITPLPAAYCVECDKRFTDVYRYRWHLSNSGKHRTPKKVRVPCPGCDKVFSKNIYMKDHYNLVHLKFYKYQCAECNKNYIRNADLVKHKRRVHDGILPPRDKICNICGRGFTTNKILTNHIRTHNGEKPFACCCGAKFSHRAPLATHQRGCTGTKKSV